MGDEGKGTKKKGKLKKWILGIGGFLVFLMIASACCNASLGFLFTICLKPFSDWSLGERFNPSVTTRLFLYDKSGPTITPT